jgi:myo-inositol-1(or 4)-monophosphatase
MINVAIKAARAAGTIINRAALDVESVRVSKKKPTTLSPKSIKRARRAIIETLLTAYPDHGIWAEESGRRTRRPRGRPHLDHRPAGRHHQLHPRFACLLRQHCLAKCAARLEQAVVYDPTRNDLFTATKGRGAFVNDRRIASEQTHSLG